MQPKSAQGRHGSSASLAGAVFRRGLALAFLWVAFTGASRDAVPYGLGAVAVILLLSFTLLPPGPRHWRPLRLLALIPGLVKLTILGGVDVAGRALRPSMPLDPEWVNVPLEGAPAQTGIALAYLLTMMPGTLAAELEDERLVLHVLDRGQNSAGLARELLTRLRAAELAEADV